MRMIAWIAVALLFCAGSLQAGGRILEIYCVDGTAYSAELLSVRDTSIIVAKQPGATNEVLAYDTTNVLVLHFRTVRLVKAEGSSYAWTGLGVGMLGGGLIGVAVGAGSVEEKRTFGGVLESSVGMAGGAVWGALLGAGAGLAIGAAASSGDIDLDVQHTRSFFTLRPFARYKEGEPLFLKMRR